jgi:serine protease inhibitor
MKTTPFPKCLMIAAIAVHGTLAQVARGALGIAEANNAFAVSLYHHLASEQGNLVVSPFSIDTALTMTYAGARGNTAVQMSQVLHYNNGDANIHAKYAAFLNQLNGVNETGNQFLIANALWAQEGYPFLNPFQNLLREDYKTDLMQIDLAGWPNFNPAIAAAARKTINQWADNHTAGKIREVLPDYLPDRDTRLILVNAVYFKGLWARPFDKGKTREATFHVSQTNFVSVQMMHVDGRFRHFQDDNVEALQLPYVSNRLSMTIILPRKGHSLEEIEEEMTVSQIERWCRDGDPTNVVVSVPRFTETTGFELKGPLKAMGMKDAFDPVLADFSGITAAESLYMEAAIHKAYLRVDETGTEAAATTAVVVVSSAELAVAFVADHPFLYVILDNRTGAILFIGKVLNPSKE